MHVGIVCVRDRQTIPGTPWELSDDWAVHLCSWHTATVTDARPGTERPAYNWHLESENSRQSA